LYKIYNIVCVDIVHTALNPRACRHNT
jgi:hypothetical protein